MIQSWTLLQVRGRHRRAVGVERTRLGIDGEHEDFTEPGGDGAQGGFQPGGNRRPCRVQAFSNLLPCEVDVGAFLEDHRDLREPVAGQGTRVVEPRQSGHGVLDGKGDPLFDLQRGIAWRGRVDGDLYVGDIGNRVDWQAGKVPRAQNRGQQYEDEHQPALRDGQAKNRVQHGPAPFSDRGLRPTFQCRPSGRSCSPSRSASRDRGRPGLRPSHPMTRPRSSIRTSYSSPICA